MWIFRPAVPTTISGNTASIAYTRSDTCTCPIGCCCLRSQYLTILSHPPVASIPVPFASIQLIFRIGASCAATCVACPVETSYIRAALSHPAEKILVPSFDQHTSRTGCSWEYAAFG